jgi:hypothetical protein
MYNISRIAIVVHVAFGLGVYLSLRPNDGSHALLEDEALPGEEGEEEDDRICFAPSSGQEKEFCKYKV